MKTFLGEEVFEKTRGILYICQYDYGNCTIKVIRELQFANPGHALDAYANIPNPESQLAMGGTKITFQEELEALHERLNNPEWVKELKNYL